MIQLVTYSGNVQDMNSQSRIFVNEAK